MDARCNELDDFVVGLRTKEPKLHLIVSGDLSRFGAPGELADARKYIQVPSRQDTAHG